MTQTVWNSNGVIALAGYWEPLAHYRRNGGWQRDDETHHARMHGVETIERLKDMAVTGVIWPGYKGLGIEFERAEWDQNLRPFARMLERTGIELGVYLQCGSYFAETFYDENPQAREWTAVDYWGQPQIYSEYYRRYYRHRPCLTHRAFSEYVGRAAKILVGEYGATFLSADNNAQMPCYTPHFRAAFHAFLKEKYATHTPAGLALFVRRYGHDRVDNIMLPCGSARRPIDALHALRDPGLEDWVEFRCRLVQRNAEIISAAAKAENPAVRLCYNMAYDNGMFNQLVWGTEAEFLGQPADFLFSEDGGSPQWTAEGYLLTHIHTCKHLRAIGRRGHFHPPHPGSQPEGEVRSMMELAIHNQGCLGHAFSFGTFACGDKDQRPSVIRFIRRHEDVFTANDTEAEIAVLRSRHSGTLNWLQATEGRLLAQTSLLRAGLQWDNVIETGLDGLDKYHLLVLPDTVSVPTDCLKPIADFVRRGGRVLAVGGALSRDEWGRLRTPAYAPPVNGENSKAFGLADENALGAIVLKDWLGLPTRCLSRLFLFPRLQHPKPFVWDPDSTRPPMLGTEAHALPLNAAAFIAAVGQALGRSPLLEPLAPGGWGGVIPTLLRSRRDGVLSLHLLRYAAGEEEAALEVRIRLPEFTPDQARGITPERARDRAIKVTRERGSVILSVPPFRLYTGVLFPAPRT